MSSPKTQKNDASVADFLAAIEHPTKREDCIRLSNILTEITGQKPAMWGDSIVGFDTYHYVYASGREGDWPITGFSPRKQNLTLYIMPGFDRYTTLLTKLGKHKTSKSCLYIKKLEDIDETVLREIIADSVAYMRLKYPKVN